MKLRSELDVEINSIEVGDRQRKVDMPTIDELAKDMREHGLLQRIGVRASADGKFDLIWGRHRYEAAVKLEWATIPAMVYPEDTTHDEALLLEIVENLRRKELSAEEKNEHTARLGALLKRHAETLDHPDFPKPTTGRGNKGVTQKVAEQAKVDQATVRHRMKKVSEAIGEPVNLDTDSPAELERKVEAYKEKSATKMTRTLPASKERVQANDSSNTTRRKPSVIKWLYNGLYVIDFRAYYDTLGAFHKEGMLNELKDIRDKLNQFITEKEADHGETEQEAEGKTRDAP